jgi:GT2 family glycosyltransferase
MTTTGQETPYHSELPEVSIIIVSYNTKELLQQCLESLLKETKEMSCEIIVIDNSSKDHSAEMVAENFPSLQLIKSKTNLGFAAANNIGFGLAQGRYILLLNSDAFLHPGALQKALKKMDANGNIGLGGARLVNPDGSWQPSCRQFPSLLNDFLRLSGLAAKHPHSRFFGRADSTWDNSGTESDADWVPGAFMIIRQDVLQKVGFFDERYFLYYEEVDLCRRIKAAGYEIRYWPDVVVTHLGGESSKTVTTSLFSPSENQLTLWRMRSMLLYFRKHHGFLGAYAMKSIEMGWHQLRFWKNSFSTEKKIKAEESRVLIRLMQQAWKETQGGKISPPKPW